MGFGIVRIDPQGGVVVLDGRVELALALQRDPEVVVGVGKVRIELDGIEPVPDRLADLAFFVCIDAGVKELDGFELQRILGIRQRLLGRELGRRQLVTESRDLRSGGRHVLP